MKETLKKLKWIFSQGKPAYPTLIISVIIGSITSAVGVYNTMISKNLIDAATSGQVNIVIKWLTVMVAIIIFNLVFGTINSLLSTYTNNKIYNELQKKFFSHVTYSEYMANSKYHSVGLLTRITSDTSTINGFICGTVPSMIYSSITLIISFFTLLSINPFIAVFTVLVFPMLLIMNKLLGTRIKKFYKDIQDQSIKYNSFVQESIQNLMIVKTFCAEKRTISNLTKLQSEKFKLLFKQTLFSSLVGIAFSIGSSGLYFVVFAWGALNLVSGAITFGTMTALLQLFNKVRSPLSSLAGCYSPIITTLAACERLMELEEMALEEGSGLLDIDNYSYPSIEFNNVTFGYKEDSPVLKNVSCTINPGETIALVGPSGQGKTTMIKLLLSLLSPNEGSLSISTDNISEKITKDHRNLISYIPQGNTLFSGTVKENITYGNIDATYEEIKKACINACAFDFINELDDKFDTVLGEKGFGLSEGQAQRISIARSFLRTRPILILDEATSALDAKTEISVLKSIKNLEHKPTCIIITHRPGALAICDRILRLEDGNLIEESKDFAFEVASDLV